MGPNAGSSAAQVPTALLAQGTCALRCAAAQSHAGAVIGSERKLACEDRGRLSSNFKWRRQAALAHRAQYVVV